MASSAGPGHSQNGSAATHRTFNRRAVSFLDPEQGPASSLEGAVQHSWPASTYSGGGSGGLSAVGGAPGSQEFFRGRAADLLRYVSGGGWVVGGGGAGESPAFPGESAGWASPSALLLGSRPTSLPRRVRSHGFRFAPTAAPEGVRVPPSPLPRRGCGYHPRGHSHGAPVRGRSWGRGCGYSRGWCGYRPYPHPP